MAGSSPNETQAARWILHGFIKLAWLSMTFLGVLLRGVMPEIFVPIVQRDWMQRKGLNRLLEKWSILPSRVIDKISIVLFSVLPGSVFPLAIDAVSKIGAGIVDPMISVRLETPSFWLNHRGSNCMDVVEAGRTRRG